MFRVLLYILTTIFVISLLRGVIGTLAKIFGSMVNPPPERASTQRPGAVPMGGELKKDPVCGTYVSTSTSVKKTIAGGDVVHFCSATCRDKFHS